MSAGWSAEINSQCLEPTMDQSASSPSICCYAELAASFINFLHYCLLSSRFCDAGKYSRGRCTDSSSGCRPIRTIGAPTSLIPPFLSQPSQFIQAGYRYRIMLACRPSGLVRHLLALFRHLQSVWIWCI